MKKKFRKTWKYIFTLLLLCFFCITLSSCSRNISENIAYCTDTQYTSYPEALAKILPNHTIEKEYPNVFTYLEKGFAVEAFDAQAISALESDVAKCWYPHYLTTVVIAIDRDRSDAHIEGWSDLLSVNELVGFADEGDTIQMLMAAIAYGLEGDGFTLNQATSLLGQLQKQGHLAKNSFESPIIICFDHQAVELKKSGYNIEIIVPNEGTFTYQKGILSNTELSFISDWEELLFSAGLRLMDGNCNDKLYPDASSYENAYMVKDYSHLNTVCQDIGRAYRRDVFNTRIYSSANQREHQYFVMLYIILIIIWTASFIRRAMQKGVRLASFLTGVILLGWIVVRLIKYQLIEADILSRYLWYAFYLFQLSLPLVLLWLAWVIDKQDEQVIFPKWLRTISIINIALISLVFTNDLHMIVFQLDLSNPSWSNEYGYGVGYYIVLAGIILQLLAALTIMLIKSGHNPRKKSFLFPLSFCLLLLLYGYGYIARIPLAWDSDFTMVVGLFIFLFIEVCFRTRLIPVNSKYTALFTHSPLNMQIFDIEGQFTLASQTVMQIDKEFLTYALAANPLQVEKDENTLLFSSPITGGIALWQVDISGLNRLHREIEESVKKITSANALLAEKEKIKRSIDEEKSKIHLLTQLEGEVERHTKRLSKMIDELSHENNQQLDIVYITLLLCYIKRRCNLFFREHEADNLPPYELIVYLDELSEIAGYSESKVLVTSQLTQTMPVHIAILLYEFFYAVLDWGVQQSCLHILVHLGIEKDRIIMRLLPSANAKSFVMDTELATAIISADGEFTLKSLDDTIGISLSFPKGGEIDA